MRFLFTMNMPSGGNDLVHQIVGEVDCKTIDELREMLIGSDFVKVLHMTYDRTSTGEKRWRARGDIVVNTFHIGKVAVYNEG